MAETRYTVAEITISTGKQTTISVDIDGERVKIPIAPEIRAYFEDQFVRPNPTPLQRKKWLTMMHLIRAAYKKGRHDERGSKPRATES